MQIKILIISLVLIFSFEGCLIFNKISYSIKTDGKGGTVEVYFFDIRSNADNPSEFEEDKNNLFSYMWKSNEFIENMKKEGKEILQRELYLSNDILNGKVIFHFNDIRNVENIILEDNFYYLTLPLADSVVSTNGEIIESQQYKRILWDSNFNNLKFEILGFSFDEERYRPMGYHFKSLGK